MPITNTYHLRSRSVPVETVVRAGRPTEPKEKLFESSRGVRKLFMRRRAQVLGAKKWKRRCEVHAAKIEQLEAEVNLLKTWWVFKMEAGNGVWEDGVRPGELSEAREKREKKMLKREEWRLKAVVLGEEYVGREELDRELGYVGVELEVAKLKQQIAEVEAEALREELAELRR